MFMEIYAEEAREYMRRSGATAADFAAVAAKATANGSRNPFAQVRTALGVDEVLARGRSSSHSPGRCARRSVMAQQRWCSAHPSVLGDRG